MMLRGASGALRAALLLGLLAGSVTTSRAAPVTEAKAEPPKLAAFSRILTGQLPRGGAQPKPSFNGSRVLLQTGPTTWWTVDRARDGTATGASQICRDEAGQLLAGGCREASLSADGSTSAFVAADALGKSGTNGVYLFNALTGRRGPRAGNASGPPAGGAPTDPPPPTEPQAPQPGRPVAFVSNVDPDGQASLNTRVYRRQSPGLGKGSGVECISCPQEGNPAGLPTSGGVGGAYGGISSAAFGSSRGVLEGSCIFSQSNTYAPWSDSGGEVVAYGYTLSYACTSTRFRPITVNNHGYVISNTRTGRAVAFFTGDAIYDIQGDEAGRRFVIHGPSHSSDPAPLVFSSNVVTLYDMASNQHVVVAQGGTTTQNRPHSASISRDGRHMAYVLEDRSEECLSVDPFDCPGTQTDSRIYTSPLGGASLSFTELQVGANPAFAVLGLKDVAFGYSGKEIYVSSRTSLASGDPDGAGGLGEDVYAISNPLAGSELFYAGFE